MLIDTTRSDPSLRNASNQPFDLPQKKVTEHSNINENLSMISDHWSVGLWQVLVFPRVRFYLEPGQEYWLHVAAVYYDLLDRPGQRCHRDTQYSFTICIEVRFIVL